MPSLKDTQRDACLLLVSNRLPITIKRSEDGKYDLSMSIGGLMSGLSGLTFAILRSGKRLLVFNYDGTLTID